MFGPSTRSRMRRRAACWSRGSRRIARFPGPAGEIHAGEQSGRVLGAPWFARGRAARQRTDRSDDRPG